MKKSTDRPAELSPKQIAQRERDCAVKYGRAGSYPGVSAKVEGLIPEKWETILDAERKRLWITEEEAAALPSWTPTLTPHVVRTVGGSTALIAKWMGETSRAERTAIVKKLTANVVKLDKLLGSKLDEELVEKLVWDHLFRLQKDQGVVLIDQIKKVVA